MLYSIGRSATRRLASTAFATSHARLVVFRAPTKAHSAAPGIYSRYSQAVRGYASAAQSKKVSASKATKKTPAKKAAKKPARKTTTKAKAKPKTKAKAKAKPKAKPASKRVKRPISPERQTVLERRALKKVALFAEPKLASTQPWQLYVTEQSKGKGDGQPLTGKVATWARNYKALSSDEMQRLESIVQQNKLANAAAYKAWVESHTAQEIYEANLARRALKKKHNFPKGLLKLIRDERIPKRPSTAYGLYTKARWASGDFSGTSESASEAMGRIAGEWKSLKAAERQPYEDLAHAQAASYEKAITGVIVRKRRSRSKSPSP
ncbi:hypothetical protein O1611_g2974 [Lasiodiplodia mahajangana]|uniref:Uncharacterized protein n=1 Tax=Lasiodiplodia mahajangana TaxID=1108764 RepID=A0ACC2JT25_9PEZI|nr:hypothetical protein O1611_g2974 [Lasiodiplodia mahajangana]